MRVPGRSLAFAGLMLASIATPATLTAGAAGPVPAVEPAPAPAALTARLQALGAGFDGRVGIAVMDLQAGWIAAFDGLTLSPQQSVSKLWVAMTVLGAVDRGALRLDRPVQVRREDMSVFNQPIQKHLIDGQPYATTVDALLVGAIAQSDNAANDILVRLVGGSQVVQRAIDARRLGALYSGPEEKVLQSRIAAVAWRPEYSFGQAFWTARDAVDPGVRAAALDAYLQDPEDGATAIAMVRALERLRRGALLSPASTAHLLQIMASTTTGPMRLKAGLGEGWSIAHKTGTGQDLGELSTGYNDVGFLTAPDGHDYAVAVLIAATRRPVPERQALMAEVARAVVAQHDGRDPSLASGSP